MHHLLWITHLVTFNCIYANKYLLGILKLKEEAGHKLISERIKDYMTVDGYLNKIASSFRILIR